MSTFSKNDKAALYAALDMIEELVTLPACTGMFGPMKAKLVELNAARRKRQRILELEDELRKLKTTP